MIGARESYLNAMKKNKWQGFNCGLTDTNNKLEILELLRTTKSNITKYLHDNPLSTDNMKFFLDLYEHEIQHHGQLIRYIYANKLSFPKSWNDRYTV